jgi:glycosyltransferase involved in cell wall biosynthesis
MDYVHYLGKVEFLDLLSLYKEAKFLVTAVLYESNSLPILEAAASGIPIIASSTPPNIEMSENLVINFFEPLDVDQCSNIILQNWKKTKGAISEEVLINSVAVELFSWENIAILYSNNFKKILNADCTS